MSRVPGIWVATASIAALSVSVSAFAQDAAPAEATATREAAPEASNELGDIVVTANRRAERVQDVPISVAALTGDQALSRGVTDTTSLANAVPGLRVDRSPASARVFLRGIGTASSTAGNEPSVSLYVDDVYIPSGAAFFANFNNIDRIEVLKGPQGTLFGRNATGGVMQVFTLNPSSTPRFDVTAGYGNYETLSGSIYASGGIVDGVSANISAYGGNQGEGWGKNVTLGKDSFKTNWNYGGRFKLLVEPTSETSILLTADYDNTKSSQGYLKPVPGTVAHGSIPGPSGFYDMADPSDPVFQTKQWGISAKVTQDMDWASLTSVTAYRDMRQTSNNTLGGVAVPVILGTFRNYETFLTQELRLASPDSSAIKWVAGIFYFDDEAAYDPLQLSGVAFGPVTLQSYARQRTKSIAGFGQVMVPLSDTTNLTGGLRYTSDKRKIDASYDTVSPAGVSPRIPAPASPQSQSFNKLTWRASIDHKLNPDLMIYASYNRGFRSGGYNIVVIPGSPIDPPVKPEVLDAFAIGEKAEFLDRRLQINIEAFYYKYKDIQVTTIITGGTLNSNAASANVKGIDVDIKAVPVENLTLTASFEYLHARFKKFPGGSFSTYNPGCLPGQSNCLTAADLSGYKLPYAPPFSATLVANYLHETSIGDLNFNVSYSYGGNYYHDPDNGRGQLDPSHNRQRKLNLVNASLRWASEDEHYDVTFWGRNITGQKYLSVANETTAATQWAPAAPATYGVTLGVHFR